MPTSTCPHYPPAGSNPTSYLCRACGAEIVNPAHPANANLALTAPTRTSAPTQRTQTKRSERVV